MVSARKKTPSTRFWRTAKVCRLIAPGNVKEDWPDAGFPTGKIGPGIPAWLLICIGRESRIG
jgi:hypothetical protein